MELQNYSPLPLTPFLLFTTILFSDIFKHNRKLDPSILKIICNKYEILNSEILFRFSQSGKKKQSRRNIGERRETCTSLVMDNENRINQAEDESVLSIELK